MVYSWRSRATATNRILRRGHIPRGPYLREGMFGGRPPQNILAAIVIGDQRMLQAEPIGDGANARAVKSLFSKFRDCGIEDRGSRLDRALLFGSLARAAGAGLVFFGISASMLMAHKITWPQRRDRRRRLISLRRQASAVRRPCRMPPPCWQSRAARRHRCRVPSRRRASQGPRRRPLRSTTP